MDDLAQPLLAFIKDHEHWAIAMMFVTGFIESSAVVSLFFPGVTLLITAGTLMMSGTLPYLPVIASAILGAALGAWVSYWAGGRFGLAIAEFWPFTRNRELLPAGIRFFEKHGGKSVFIGRFFGALRAAVPLAAGVMRMPSGRFWVANIAASLVWAPMVLMVGDAIGEAGDRLIGSGATILVVFATLAVVGVGGVVWAAMRSTRSKP
jgi:membrane protein DedA with SNARE-associated domain